MSPDDFSTMGRALFSKGWQTRLAEKLEVDGSTIRRWVGSGMAVPPAASAFLSMMADRQETRGALVYERQRIGLPVEIIVDGAIVQHEKLLKPRPFPGTPDPKRMPSIHASFGDHDTNMALAAQANDMIETHGISFILTRHPDPYHLGGYRGAALAHNHQTAAIRYGDHFYSLLAHRMDGPPMVTHHIATHQAVNRVIWSAASSPAQIVHQELF